MDVRDGLIIGVFNYCDRWCERCILSARCELFVEDRQLSLDLPTPIDLVRRQKTTGLGAEEDERSRLATLTRDDLPDEFFNPQATIEEIPRPVLSAEEASLLQRVRDATFRLWDWSPAPACAENGTVQHAVAVIQHFAVFSGPKMSRALIGRADGDHLDPASDATGSAKALLLALDQLGDAWLELAEHGAVSLLDAESIISALQRLTDQVESFFPYARRFVRPGFDEPEEVAMLRRSEEG